MENIKIFKSVINSDMVNKFEESKWCTDLMQFATYKCQIHGLIASAYLFCPEIIQVKDYIFIKKFWNCSVEESISCIDRLEKQFHNDKKQIEMFVNTWSIGGLFFVGESGELMDDEENTIQFGNALVFFWKNRVKELFPDKNFVVKLGEDLMGELGICITLYQE